jgi:hypothetical protein
MEILLKILHFQHGALPPFAELGVTDFRDFAIVCDKYDCLEAVSFANKAWLDDLMPRIGTGDEAIVLLSGVAFLDNPTIFQELTRNLILGSLEGFLNRPLEDNLFPFPAFELQGRLRLSLP